MRIKVNTKTRNKCQVVKISHAIIKIGACSFGRQKNSELKKKKRMKERKKRLKGCRNRRTKTHAYDKLLPLIIQLNPQINPACSNTRNKLPDTEQFPNLFSVHEILYSCATIEFPNALSKRPQTTSVFYRFANQRPHCPRSLVLGVRFEKMFSNLVIW